MRFIIGIVLCFSVFAEKKLDFVLAVWRHGARSPMTFSKTSSIGDSFEIWPDGTGQLTENGKEMHRELGRFLRNRYKDFYPFEEEYRRKDIYVRSTDRDRTLLSAVSNLGAFLNVTTPGNVPFPVHTLPTETDNLLRYPNMNCKRFSEILKNKEIQQTPGYKALDEKYADDFKKMAELLNDTTEYNLNNMWTIFDNVDCHKYNNFTETVPAELLSGPLYDRLTVAAGLAMKTLFTDIEGNRRIELSRMQGGVLLGDILEQLRSPLKQYDFDEAVKYLVYSAHDTTLAAALVAMNAQQKNFKQPFYASALLFERYFDDSTGTHSIEIWYKNNKEFTDLTAETCGESPCSLDQLEQAWLPVIPLNWDAECHHMDPSPEHFQALETKSNILAVILALSWAIFISYFILSKRSSKHPERLALVEQEFSMGVEDKWSNVPASNFVNPSI